jgi:hypothetical protein
VHPRIRLVPASFIPAESTQSLHGYPKTALLVFVGHYWWTDRRQLPRMLPVWTTALPTSNPRAATASSCASASLRSPCCFCSWYQDGSCLICSYLALLLFAEKISKLVGGRGLLAFERLMGLILTAVAVEMLLRGIEAFVRQL